MIHISCTSLLLWITNSLFLWHSQNYHPSNISRSSPEKKVIMILYPATTRFTSTKSAKIAPRRRPRGSVRYSLSHSASLNFNCSRSPLKHPNIAHSFPTFPRLLFHRSPFFGRQLDYLCEPSSIAWGSFFYENQGMEGKLEWEGGLLLCCQRIRKIKANGNNPESEWIVNNSTNPGYEHTAERWRKTSNVNENGSAMHTHIKKT